MATQIRAALILLRRSQFKARTGLSRAYIYARLQTKPKRPGDIEPTIPKQISIGGKAVGWIEVDMEAWIAAQEDKYRKAA